MKKKGIYIIVPILMLFMGVGIGIIGTKITAKANDTKKVEEKEPTIKESPYTLDELYAIVEDPERFYEENKAMVNTYAVTLFNFYDYFSKSTPVKIATKVERDNEGKVTKVLETDYIDYEEYMKQMYDWRALYESWFEISTEEEIREWEKLGYNYNFTYRTAINFLIYNSLW